MTNRLGIRCSPSKSPLLSRQEFNFTAVVTYVVLTGYSLADCVSNGLRV